MSLGRSCTAALACSPRRGCVHRMAIHVAQDVVRELLHGSIPVGRRPGQPLGNDALQIASQKADQPGGGQSPRGSGLTGHGGRQRRRIRGEHRLNDLRGGGPIAAEGAGAAQQLIEQDAQRVHVRGHRGRLIAQHLGAGVERGEKQIGSGLRVAAIRGQCAGYAKIQQLRLTLRRHQNIAGLQIAVYNQALVCEADSRRDLQEQSQALVDREAAGVAPGVDALSFHVLHHQVREPPIGDAAAQERRDIGVLQLRQDLPFAPQPFLQQRGGKRRRHSFDRHKLPHFAVFAGGPIHCAHSTGADQLAGLVDSEAGQARRRRRSPLADRFVGRQQTGDCGAQLRIGAAFRFQPGLPLGARRQRHRIVE
jgi:hypothetical protein